MLNLKNICLTYGRSAAAFSINIPELQIQQSKITCLLGKNGSGKTTLLNIIGGHLLPQAGTIILNSVDITKNKPQQRPISTVFQEIGLFPHLTVLENIELAIEPNRLFGFSKLARKQSRHILKEYALIELSDKLPNELSIGQQQKVAVTRAITTNPDVLLLDEPTSALDFENIKNLRLLLAQLRQQQTVPVILIVSHDLPFVMNVADEIKYMEDGQIVFEGSVAEFSASPYYVN
jgi:ABC-type Fe3+/spermidine/putrescine transport system ATPase subunit